MTYKETLDFLFSQLPVYQDIGKKAFKKDLTNIRSICEKIGNPQNALKCIHIAGTNGKGSTSHMIASVLQEAGYKVGLYTSPHLQDFRERIKINGIMIPKSDIISFVQSKKEVFKGISPSFFEWTVGLALYHFNENSVDFAVIETGLGGRLDSTNIIHPVLSVITNVGLDHVDMLGDTLDKIAYEKAGIIKENVTVVIGNSSGQKEVFLEKASIVDAPIIFAENIATKDFNSDLVGFYQKENIHTATVALTSLQKAYKILDSNIITGLQNVIKNTGLRGRWDIIKHKPTIVLETAHNIDGFRMVIKQLENETYENLIMVLGFVKQKPLDKIINLLPKDAKYIISKANIERSENPLFVAEAFKKAAKDTIVIEALDDAISMALKESQQNDLIYIGGSNFIVAEALDFFDKEFEI